ncbi:MAG: hypothetical protein J6N43_00295 [Prevotella sp.]|nr:hypothetical protein [Prevotella sp.]
MKKEYLSFEQVKKILSPHLQITNRIGRQNIFRASDNSIVALSNSKDFGGDKWWYSIFVYEWAQLGVNNVCFTLGEQGIALLPMAILLEYAKYADYNDNYANGRRFFVRIKKENGKYLLYHSGEKDVDITSMFYPAD